MKIDGEEDTTEGQDKSDVKQAAAFGSKSGTWPEVFMAFLRLGLTSFGGPVAHLGYFRDEYVVRPMGRRSLRMLIWWLFVSSCRDRPSSQVGIAIGMIRAGFLGALAAGSASPCRPRWRLVVFASGVQGWAVAATEWLHGLQVVAVAVVADAVSA